LDNSAARLAWSLRCNSSFRSDTTPSPLIRETSAKYSQPPATDNPDSGGGHHERIWA
jgi:hypothetical protein